MSQISETVAAVRADLNRVLLERTQAVDYALLALLTRQHYLQVGPPGCLDGETQLLYKRGKRNSGRKTTLARLYRLFNGLTPPKGPGTRAWDDLEADTYLHSYNHETGVVFYNRIESVMASGVKPCLAIHLSSGETLRLTHDHPILTPDGFIQAGQAEPGTQVLCRGSMRPGQPSARGPRKERMVVTALKYYQGGWNGDIYDRNTGKWFYYRRQHRSRLVVEADMNHMTYAAYVYALKHDPAAVDLQYLPTDIEVHHANEDALDDRRDNLVLLSKAEHARQHGALSNFGVEYTRLAQVVAWHNAGDLETYDIQMAAPANNFATAGGLIVHNTAKSMLVDALHARLTDATHFTRIVSGDGLDATPQAPVRSPRFKRVLNPGTTDADILGPPDLLALADEGRHVRRHARSIVEAHIAFLDEIGRANKMVYDLLLQILGEEREVDEIGMDAPLALPLISCFAASNSHLTGDEHLAALNNRFLLREEVTPLSERASLSALAKNPPKIRDVQATMTLDDLRAAQAEAQTVRCTGTVLDACLDLKDTLAREGVCVSDRMWVWSFPLLKAHAWLHGESEVQLDDLVALGGAWWQDPKERPVVQRAIFSVACPLAATALEIQDDFTDLVKQAPAPDAPDFVSEGLGINSQLKDMVTRLMAEVKGSKARDKAPAIRALQQISTAQRQFAATLASRMNVGSVDISDVVSVG